MLTRIGAVGTRIAGWLVAFLGLLACSLGPGAGQLVEVATPISPIIEATMTSDPAQINSPISSPTSPPPTPTPLPTDTPVPVPPTPTLTPTPLSPGVLARAPTVTRTPTPPPPPPDATPTPNPVSEVVNQICPQPEACLYSPQPGEVVSGRVEIVGAARRPGFAYYKVEIQPEGSVEWQLLEFSERAVRFGTLAKWSTSGVPNGRYQLRLVVVDKNGNYYPQEPRTWVTVANEPKPYVDPFDKLRYNPTPTGGRS